MTDLNTPKNGGEIIQQVEFEPLYTGLREVSEISQLQDRLEITTGIIEGQIPLFLSLNFYDGDDLDPLWNKNQKIKDLFAKLFPDIVKNVKLKSSGDGQNNKLFIDYNGTGDFKKAMKKILKPKAEASVIDSDEKREQEKIVERAINRVMG